MLTLTQIDAFEEIIDVRTPAEYEIDHIPKANNFPVLDNDERIQIGTLYKESVFQAKQQGAALITSNISSYLSKHFASRPETWHPLIYCWRGGKRSEALTHILNQIGWQATRLPGGYKAYRKMVGDGIDALAPRLNLKVICGRTGVGKSALLNSLQKNGAQILDLEKLANHRGSVLGNPVTGQQPTQKFFDSTLCQALRSLHNDQVVYVEAESRRIGKIQLPTSLLNAIRAAECIRLECDFDARIEYLIDEYEHFLKDSALLESALSLLIPFIGKQKINQWINWKSRDDAREMVRGLLSDHYDPIYIRSMKEHFTHYADAQIINISTVSEDCFAPVSDTLLNRK